jgi:hypothetical protein
MAAIAKLIRNAPRETLEAFLDAQQPSLGEQLRSFGPHDDYAGPLLKSVDELSDEDHARLTVNAERIGQMATDAGRTALLSVVEDRPLVVELENDYDRSLWVFLNETHSFRRAEEIRYTDERRHGRMWSGYAGPKQVEPDISPGGLDAFRTKALKLVGSLGAYCEIYRRTRPNFGGRDSELYQLTLYYDDLPDTYLEFEEQRLVRRHRRPVVEASVTYEPATGVIEVVSSGGKFRDELARTFADTILAQAIGTVRIALRRFDLTRLLRPFDFPFDVVDGIESVKVVSLRLQRIGAEERRLILECPRRAANSIWNQASEELKQGDLEAAGYVATQAKLSIRFLPGPDSPRGKTLPVTITVPNGCDLKGRTERERVIGGKYLKRWGLMAEL